MRRWANIVLGLIAACVAASGALAQERFALIIGNGDYPASLGRLENTYEDAERIAAALRLANFDVDLRTDLDAEGMDSAIDAFLAQLDANPGSIAFFYYSGHGTAAAIRGQRENLLIPARENFTAFSQIPQKSMRLSRFVDALETTGAKAAFVVSDACRNEFALSEARGADKGFVALPARAGMLIAYATAEGATAPDDGVFATALAEQITKPGQDASVSFLRAMQTVSSRRGGGDQPYFTPGNIPADVCFMDCEAEPIEPAAPVLPGGLEAGQSITDCEGCPELVVLPVGEAWMGSPLDEEGRKRDEAPQHLVHIARPIAVGRFEVTFEQWDACVDAGGCSRSPDDEGWGRGRRPVINVSWWDAQDYVSWLSEVTGKAYRLLSEAEWEYAARAGTTSAYFFGDNPGNLCRFANVADEASTLAEPDWDWSSVADCDDGFHGTAPVGSFRPNPWGLFDMIGNVSEWVEDCRNTGYNGAPSEGEAWLEGDCSMRMHRGGGWTFVPASVRSAKRGAWPSDYTVYSIGFRVARDLDAE